MATAEELLAQMEENPELYTDSIGPVNGVIVINAEERTIELPESEKIFGVESDKASERKYFKCPKIVGDNIDLSTLNLFINFKNANNEADIYPIDDVEVDGDYIAFSWKLSRKVTAYKTDASKNQLLSFIFCAKSGEDPDVEWNTTLCSDGVVLEGLEPGESIAEDNPDIIQYILERLDSAGTITPEQISEAVKEHLLSNPIKETDPTVPSWAKEEAPDKSLTQEGKAADAKEVGDRLGQLSDDIANLGSGTGTVVSSVEPAHDDIPKVFLTGDEYSNMNATKNEVNMEMEYISKTLHFSAYILIKWQGSSSITNGYPKHNFTIKMFEDEARETKKKLLFKDWKFEKHKYVWKSNYIDVSHARNIVCARLWSEVVASRSDYDTLPEELRTSPNNGAIDGFPIKVYINGTYDGIYTWNIGKDDWMWNMDEDNVNHLMICAKQNVSGENPCNFNKTITAFDDGNWSIEVGTQSADLVTSFNNLISCVKDTDDETFKSTIGNYLDIQSAIDYYAFHYAICGLDGLGKNVLMGTFDGVKWIIGSYDMDSVFGLYWNGSQFVSAEYACPENYQANASLLWKRIEKVFKEELQTRYFELRKSVLSFSNICTHFERFMDSIGTDLYKDDSTLYPRTLSSTNNITQIRNFVRDRLIYVDNEIANLGQTTYTITNNLTSVTTDNTATVVTEGSSYVATITADTGSEINSVAITMGGTDVTSSVYADGAINITSVTGDIVITVVAQSGISDEGLLYSLPEAITFDGTNCVDTGVDVLETNSDWTMVIDVEIPESVSVACTIFSNATTTLNSLNDTVEFNLQSSGQGRAYILSASSYILGYGKGIDKGVHAKLVFTRDSASPLSKISYSVDGTVKAPVSNTNAYDGTKTRNNIILGGCLNGTTVTSGFVGGVINDFRIYNRVLTDSEITTYIS